MSYRRETILNLNSFRIFVLICLLFSLIRERTGSIQMEEFKIGLSLLCSTWLEEKYKCRSNVVANVPNFR